MLAASLIAGAYLLGSIPFGLLIGLARGVDIREQGSGNIGATNAGRVLGRKWGLLCLALDLLKGFGPALAANVLLVPATLDAGAALLWIAVGAAAVLGHTFPIYLGFRGGKGVATTIGVALGVYPYLTVAIALALLAYAIARYGTGYVSVGSLALAAVFPLAVALQFVLRDDLTWSAGWPLLAAAAALGGLIIVRHSSNIARLLRGAETPNTRPKERQA